jgi:hypothetical protein
MPRVRDKESSLMPVTCQSEGVVSGYWGVFVLCSFGLDFGRGEQGVDKFRPAVLLAGSDEVVRMHSAVFVGGTRVV